jgi:hypothetical protein
MMSLGRFRVANPELMAMRVVPPSQKKKAGFLRENPADD